MNVNGVVKSIFEINLADLNSFTFKQVGQVSKLAVNNKMVLKSTSSSILLHSYRHWVFKVSF